MCKIKHTFSGTFEKFVDSLFPMPSSALSWVFKSNRSMRITVINNAIFLNHEKMSITAKMLDSAKSDSDESITNNNNNNMWFEYVLSQPHAEV